MLGYIPENIFLTDLVPLRFKVHQQDAGIKVTLRLIGIQADFVYLIGLLWF